MKKITALLMAIVLFGSTLTGCEQVDPLDVVYTNEYEQITARQLLEGSDEVIRYAKYISLEGNTSSSTIAGTAEINSETNKFSANSYYQDDENYSCVISGEYVYDSGVSGIFQPYLNCECDYYYYEGQAEGQAVDGFHSFKTDHDGHDMRSDSVSIKLRRILLPDYSNMNMNFYGGNVGSDKQYMITFTGDLSSFNGAFGRMSGAYALTQVCYYFSVDTHKLVKVTAKGLKTEKKTYASKDIEWKYEFNAEIKIKEISYTDHEVCYPSYDVEDF